MTPVIQRRIVTPAKVPYPRTLRKPQSRNGKGRGPVIPIHAPSKRLKALPGYAGSAALAVAITVAKIALSFIARSAMVLRSSSTPASLVPWMNCE